MGKKNNQPGTHGEPLTFSASRFEIIEAAMEDGKPSGPPKFEMMAYTGGPMMVSGYTLPVVVDLAGLRVPNQQRPVRFEHDPIAGLGHTTLIAKSATDLRCSGVLSRDTVQCHEVVASARNGFPFQASIGATVERKEVLAAGAVALVNGQQINGPAIIARQTTLREVSIVDAGADDNTSVAIAASAAKPQGVQKMDEFSTWLQASGFDAATLSEQQTAGLKASFDALNAYKAKEIVKEPEPAPADPVADIRAAQSAEYQRIGDIESVCGEGHTSIKAQAIREGWDKTRTELEVLRASRPKAPAAHFVDRTATDEVLECAIRLGSSEQHSAIEKEYEEKVLEAASRNFRRMTLQGLIQANAMREGRPVPTALSSESEWVQAAFSTASLPTILGNTMNKVLLQQYNAKPSTARQVAKKLSANDFKTHTAVRLSGDTKLAKLGAAGEIAHGTLGEQAFTYSVNTYGKMYGITRQMLVNDDLGALMDIPAKIGIGAAQALEDAFYTLLLANTSDFFGTTNKNYISGSTTNLGADGVGLAAAIKKFRDQVNPDGYPIQVDPTMLLVPTSIEVYAKQLMNSVFWVGSTAQGQSNVFAGLMTPLVTPYLNNTSYSGYSTTAFYLFADPGVLAAFGIAYLNGVETPVIESAPQEPDVLGQGWRGYMDFGVCQLDPRGAVMSKGAT